NPPLWLAGHNAFRPSQIEKINALFRLRAQSVQAVDGMIGRIESRLAADGVADNTYIVFSSDNGYHMGEYRLNPGKMTAFDTDIRVPLVAAGPGIASGATSRAAVENIDLAPTYEQLAGAPTPSNVDGRALTPLLHGGSGANWRTASLVEHHGPDTLAGDPDLPA